MVHGIGKNWLNSDSIEIEEDLKINKVDDSDSYIIEGSSLAVINGANGPFVKRGQEEFNSAPVYVNSYGWFLFKHSPSQWNIEFVNEEIKNDTNKKLSDYLLEEIKRQKLITKCTRTNKTLESEEMNLTCDENSTENCWTPNCTSLC